MGDPGPPPPLQAGLRRQEVREPFSRGSLWRPARALPRPRTQQLLAARGDSPEDSQLSPDTGRPPPQTAGSRVSAEMQKREKADAKDNPAAREAKMGATLEGAQRARRRLGNPARTERGAEGACSEGRRKGKYEMTPKCRDLAQKVYGARAGGGDVPETSGRGPPTHPHPRT